MDEVPVSEKPVLAGEPATKALTAMERAALAILVVTVAATCFLISAGEGNEAGSVPWRSGSALRVITDLLNLNRQYPTARGVEVKWLVEGLGAAAIALAVGVGLLLRPKPEDELLEAAAATPAETPRPKPFLTMSLPTAAQATLLLFALWTVASAFWSPWPAASLGEGLRQVIITIWAIGLGRMLSRSGAKRGAQALLAILVLMAGLGLWYHAERNPVQRLKFPIGNPLFFAACLLPGLTIAAAMAAEGWWSPERGGGRPSMRTRIIGVIRPVVFGAVMLWAFKAADAHGPALGLAAGLLVIVFLLIRRRWRIGLAAGLVITAAVVWTLRAWPVSWLMSRPDTMRSRLYAWHYALDLLRLRPHTGVGQGGYYLLAEQLSRLDAERDPLAFAGGVGHAHNEWLEIMTDTGAIGLALMMTALGVTIWAAVSAIRKRWRQPAPIALGEPVWYLLGLLAALVAIIVEAATDVSLRMPGLPVIFYTVLGLIWAMARGDAPETPLAAKPALDRSLRIAGIIGAVALAWGIVSVSARDWAGAVAHGTVAAQMDKHQWDSALNAASTAATWRTDIEGTVLGTYYAVRVAHAAAEDRAQQLQGMVQSRDSRQDPNAVVRLAREDTGWFEHYFEIGDAAGMELLARMRGYPIVGRLLSDLWWFRLNVHQMVAGVTGSQPPNPEPYLFEARRWMAEEFARDRLNAENGLRLLQLAHGSPGFTTLDEINVLRIPLRRGPVHPGVENAVAALAESGDFTKALDGLVASAQAALAANTGQWQDEYAPEALRLAAILRKEQNRFGDAVQLSEQAARLSKWIAPRFPAAVAYADRYTASYLLLADPEHPERAVELIAKAIHEWPARVDPEQLLETRRTLSVYLLAAGKEAEARQLITELSPPKATPEMINQNTGYEYVELAQIYIGLPPQRRPHAFAAWSDRALQLVPDWPSAHILAVRLALERGDEPSVTGQLEALEKTVEQPRQLAGVLQGLLTDFPKSAALRQFASARFRVLPFPTTASAPATQSAPASAPAATRPARPLASHGVYPRGDPRGG